MKVLILAILLLSGCSAVQEAPERPDLETRVQQHDVVLGLITGYVARLQEVGALPRPEDLPKKEETK